MDEIEDYQKEVDLQKDKQTLRKTVMIISGIFSIAGFVLAIYFISGITGYVIGEDVRSNLFSLIFLAFIFMCWVASVFFWSYLNRERKKENIDIKKLIETRGWTSIIPLEYNEKVK